MNDKAIQRAHSILSAYMIVNSYPSIDDDLLCDIVTDIQMYVRARMTDGDDWETLLDRATNHASFELQPNYNPEFGDIVEGV